MEDRWAPEQASKKYAEERVKRDHEDAISTLTAAGIPKALGTIKRVYKWNTDGIVPDDGFRDLYTINRTEMQNPRDVQAKLTRPPAHLDARTGDNRTMINSDNIARLTHVPRELQGPAAGFGSVLPKHGSDHDQRRFNTTYLEVHGTVAQQRAPGMQATQSLRRSPEETGVEHFTTTKQVDFTLREAGNNIAAGTKYKDTFMELSGKQNDNMLSAEMLRTDSDPQKNSKIQRSWMYSEDPGMRAREQMQGVNAIPEEDNELSLPLGKGDYFNRPKQLENGANRHFRTDVTVAPKNHLTCGFRLG